MIPSNLTVGAGFTTTTLDGGDPSGRDTANLAGASGLVTVNLANSTLSTNTTITGYGGPVSTVTLIGDEVANLNANSGGLTINGTAQPDALTYTPTGASAGTVTSAGLNTVFNFTQVASTFTLDAGGRGRHCDGKRHERRRHNWRSQRRGDDGAGKRIQDRQPPRGQ